MAFDVEADVRPLIHQAAASSRPSDFTEVTSIRPEGPRATRSFLRVALVTCAEFAGLDADDRLLLEPLAALGIHAEPAVWDDPAVDWSGYDLVVLRSPWDYPPRRDAFVRWARKVDRLANPSGVVAWNTDKRYLRDIAAAGVPVVQTAWVEPGASWTPGEAGEYVIKPAVSAGSADTGRYDLADAEHRRLAVEHMARLGAAGRLTMVQPYLAAVDTVGEAALVYLRDPATGRLAFSHAARKGPLLTGPHLGVNVGLFVEEEIAARTADPAELAVAERAIAAVPGGERLLYARVDLIPGPDGAPLLVELELTEPSLFLATAPGAAARFAAAIADQGTPRRSRTC